MDYKDSLNLPKTDFPMKASLSRKEPEMLKMWEEMDIYKTLTMEHSHAEIRREEFARGSFQVLT